MESEQGIPTVLWAAPSIVVLVAAAIASIPKCVELVAIVRQASRRNVAGRVGFGIVAFVLLLSFWLSLLAVGLLALIMLIVFAVALASMLWPAVLAFLTEAWNWAEVQPVWLQVFIGLAAFFVGVPFFLFSLAVISAGVSTLLSALAGFLEPAAQSLARLRDALLG